MAFCCIFKLILNANSIHNKDCYTLYCNTACTKFVSCSIRLHSSEDFLVVAAICNKVGRGAGRHFTRTLGGKTIGVTLTKSGGILSLSSSLQSSFPFPSLPFPLLLSFPLCATHIQLSSLVSAMSSPSGVWGEATADIEFGAIWQLNLASGENNFVIKFACDIRSVTEAEQHSRHLPCTM